MISAMETLVCRCKNLKSALYRASRGAAAGRSRRTARLQRAQIADELSCAVFPGTLERKTPAGFAGDAERADAGASQVGVQGAHRGIRNHVQRAGHRKGSDRGAAGQRLELND